MGHLQVVRTRRNRLTQLRRDLARQLKDDATPKAKTSKMPKPLVFDPAVVIAPTADLSVMANNLVTRLDALLAKLP